MKHVRLRGHYNSIYIWSRFNSLTETEDLSHDILRAGGSYNNDNGSAMDRRTVFLQDGDSSYAENILADNPNLKTEVDDELISSAADLHWLDAQDSRIVNIRSQDGLRLSGIWLPSENKSASIVILAHGYSGKAEKWRVSPDFMLRRWVITY